MRKLFTTGFLLVVIFLINGGVSLKCYECRSDKHKGCQDEMDKKYLKDCPAKENVTDIYCRKIHQKLRFRNDEDYIWIRECAKEKNPHGCYLFKWVELAYIETCECDEDSCNRVSSHKLSTLTIAVTFSTWIINNFR